MVFAPVYSAYKVLEDTVQLGSKIRELRLARGLNQRQLADAAHLTQATISRIEQGKIYQLKSSALAGLAAALDVSVDSLIGKTDRTPDTCEYISEDAIAFLSDNQSDTYQAATYDQINTLLQRAIKDIIMRKSFQEKLYRLFRDEIEASLKDQK